MLSIDCMKSIKQTVDSWRHKKVAQFQFVILNLVDWATDFFCQTFDGWKKISGNSLRQTNKGSDLGRVINISHLDVITQWYPGDTLVIPSATIVNNILDSCKKPQRMTVWDWCSVDHDWQDLNVTVWLQQYPPSDILKRLLWLKQGRAEFGWSQYLLNIISVYLTCLQTPGLHYFQKNL